MEATHAYHQQMRAEVIRKKINTVRWYHIIELAPGILTPGVNDAAAILNQMKLPADCHGLRVLDLGARDGAFSFELERRGAAVVAVDYMPKEKTGFLIAAELLQSNVEYRHANIFDLTPEEYGTFDIIFFLGLLYHLPDPMRAIRIVRSLCRGEMFLETHVIDNAFLMPDGSSISLEQAAPGLSDAPIMQFYPKNSLEGDWTNYWGPNIACLKAMLEENNFEIISVQVVDSRATLHSKVTDDDRLARAVNAAYAVRTGSLFSGSDRENR